MTALHSSMDYFPTVSGNSVFAAAFGLLLIVQLGLSIRYRTWGFMVGMLGGLLIEGIGHVARFLMHVYIFDSNCFIM